MILQAVQPARAASQETSKPLPPVFPVREWGEFQMLSFVQSLSELKCLRGQIVLQDQRCRIFIRFGAAFALLCALRAQPLIGFVRS